MNVLDNNTSLLFIRIRYFWKFSKSSRSLERPNGEYRRLRENCAAGAIFWEFVALKDEFYSHADGLIGVCPDRDAIGEHADCLVSKVLSLDLRAFPKEVAQG